MADEISEYTVRDYSAMDRQIDEIARRERILTNRLNLENLKRFALIGLMVLGGVCLLILALAVAYRIAFPPDKKILENPIPLEVTVKNEPIIIEKKNTKIIENKTPSNKIFGLREKENKVTEESNSKNTSKTILEDKSKKPTKLDNTSVVTFKTETININGLRTVTTGWNWKNPNANEPYKQYCYTMNAVDKVQVDLAVIATNTNSKKSLYNVSTAKKNNLSKAQWNNLEQKCQWYIN